MHTFSLCYSCLLRALGDVLGENFDLVWWQQAAVYAALLAYKKKQRLAPSHESNIGKVLPGFHRFILLRREMKINEFHTERYNRVHAAVVNDVSEAKQFGKFN